MSHQSQSHHSRHLVMCLDTSVIFGHLQPFCAWYKQAFKVPNSELFALSAY